jgi:hypothetical protein
MKIMIGMERAIAAVYALELGLVTGLGLLACVCAAAAGPSALATPDENQLVRVDAVIVGC